MGEIAPKKGEQQDRKKTKESNGLNLIRDVWGGGWACWKEVDVAMLYEKQRTWKLATLARREKRLGSVPQQSR